MSNKQDQKRWKGQFNETCLNRDGNKCVFCNETKDLDVHHITDRHEMPNGGFAPSNGISVCSEHHWDCEEFHMTGTAKEGYSPDDLYKRIGSSYAKAHKDCEELK